MNPCEALEIAEQCGMGDGATLAYAAELCGMDYDDFIDAISQCEDGGDE
jgi:hypothetical protein